ncbi:hypothetical protein ACA910_000920 [Epithemia clementina (nom. ined.)]
MVKNLRLSYDLVVIIRKKRFLKRAASSWNGETLALMSKCMLQEPFCDGQANGRNACSAPTMMERPCFESIAFYSYGGHDGRRSLSPTPMRITY